MHKIRNNVVLDVVYIWLSEEHFLHKFGRICEVRNMQICFTNSPELMHNFIASANLCKCHNTPHSKCNFKNFFKPLWTARALANKLRVHVNHVGSQRPGKTKTWYLQDSLKLSSFLEVTVKFVVSGVVGRTDFYIYSLLIFSRIFRQMPSNSDFGGCTPSYILHTHAFRTYLLAGLFTLQKGL